MENKTECERHQWIEVRKLVRETDEDMKRGVVYVENGVLVVCPNCEQRKELW